MKTKIILLMTLLTTAQVSFSQGFFNLDFEQANVSGDAVGSLVPAAATFPDWQVFYGTVQTAQVEYDGIDFSGPSVSLVDNNEGIGPEFEPIQGNYSAVLFNLGAPTGTGSPTISQTGFVPYNTSGIQLYANEMFGSFVVTLGGDTINMMPVQTFSGYTVYDGDISAFASQLWGQEATLSITEMGGSDGGLSWLLLDDISFISPAIPEPSALALMLTGGMAFGACARWRKCRRVPL